MKKKTISLLILIFIFMLLSILVKLEYTKSIDNYIYTLIISIKSENITKFFKMITRLGNLKELIILALLFLLIFRNLKGILLIIHLINTQVFNVLVKGIIKRNRPNVLRIIQESFYSFPSGHAMLSFIIYGFLIYLIYKNLKHSILKYIIISILILLIILIGISRIYLGVHYFTDILGGYLLAIIYLLLFKKILDWGK